MKMKHGARRQQVIESAVRLIGANGWENTDHRDIAADIGVASQTIRSHFPKRADLRQAVLASDLADPIRRHIEATAEHEQRMKPEDRKTQLLDKALALACVHGYKHVTIKQITDAAHVTPTLYARYFRTIGQLRVEIMRAAIKRRVLPIIAQGLVFNDPHAMRASDELKKTARDTIGA